jgi:hypothetical protein
MLPPNQEQQPFATSGAKSAKVRSLYERCLESEKKSTRKSFENLKNKFARELVFGGPILRAFSTWEQTSDFLESDPAAESALLHKMFRDAKSPDKRLRLFAQWVWGQLGIRPESSLGKDVVAKLTATTLKRLRRIPWNDLYYAHLIQIWRPYADSLFNDAETLRNLGGSLEQRLSSLDYDNGAIEIFLSKTWRSPIEFTCEWLAARGGVKMLKPRQDPDIARTLRNAYTKVFGKGAPHLLLCIFCGKPAVSEFHASDRVSASHCASHTVERLPISSSEAWLDLSGRRWWRSGRTIYCQPSPTPG